ncbi:MAG TPA: protein kinase [Vicinamibacterales bacterium]|nr:protein kinase [Vicinamibacterales bacterium]
MPAGDSIDELAAAIADGRSVDWKALRPDSEPELLEELRLIDQIADLHRHSVDPLEGSQENGAALKASAQPPAPTTVLFTWGPVQVVELIGAGAFGDVYRAWDTTLGREVALKLLRSGPDARSAAAETIIREGHLLARVRHPNVMAVYGAQQIGGRIGIWGEFLRGRTLAQMVTDDGPVNAQEAAAYAEPICRALSAVHRAGAIHRDVKAQNVMREFGGRIVLMDFGLGRDSDVAGSDHSLEVAGTPLYLAPELFRGEPASPQSDVYSVGVLLFYLLTGRFPVEAGSMAALTRQHAAGTRLRLQDLRSDLPVAFVNVVERALEPDRAARFQSAGALQSALSLPGQAPISVTSDTSSRRVYALLALAALAVVIAAIAGYSRLNTSADTVLSFTLPAPDGAAFTQGSRNAPRISPDGKYVAFIATADGVSELWLRDLADLTPRRLNGTAGAFSPFWSADSQSIWFVAGGMLQRVTITGARSESIPMSHEYCGAAWNRSNLLLIARDANSGLVASQDGKGAFTPVTTVNAAAGEESHCWPQFLPDGRRFLFYVNGSESVKGAYVGSLDGSPPRRLIVTDASAVYASGHILYARDGALFAHAFDAGRATLSGQPHRLRDQIAATWESLLLVSASDTDRLVFATRTSSDNRQLGWRSLTGRALGLVGAPDRLANPAVSRDGRYVALQMQSDSQRSVIRIYDTRAGGWSPNVAAIEGENPVWGPDQTLTYSQPRGGLLEVARIAPLGEGSPAVLISAEKDRQNKQVTDVSPDGTLIAYTAYRMNGSTGNYDLWLAHADGRPIRTVAPSDDHEISGRFSPDGKWLAFASNHPALATDAAPGNGEPARMHVYVQRIDDPQPPVRMSLNAVGGYDPLWSSQTSVLFIDTNGWMNSAEIVNGQIAPAGTVRLFQTGVWSPGVSRNHYDVAPDRSRIILATPLSGAFTVVTGWPALLGR